MKPLALIVPERHFEIDNSGYPNPEEIPAWLENLPLGNPEKAAEQLIILLGHYNTVVLEPSQRRALMDNLVITANENAKALQAKYRDSAYPLAERNAQRYGLVDKLFSDMAVGYKCIVLDMHNKQLNAQNGELFISSVDKSINFLAKQLLASYAIYEKEPEGVWSDLHQLYLCTEHFARHEQMLDRNEKLHHLCIIAQRSYRKIALLSIANPYHLMQGEAHLIYSYLNKWAVDTKVVPLGGYVASTGDLIIDLSGDKGPSFIYNMELDYPELSRTIEMTKLMERFNETINQLSKRRSNYNDTGISFNERMRRDMLVRLQQVWVERLQRKGMRRQMTRRIRMAEGLSACHYFVDGEQDFFPERDEVKYYRPQDLGSSLSLVPDDYEPWKHKKTESQVTSGIDNVRVSNFEKEALDIWKKIYANESHASAMRHSMISHYETYYWHLINHSMDGIGLKRFKLSNSRVRVGSVVAFREESNDNEVFFIGAIRWAKQQSPEEFLLGIQIIPGKPSAIAARGVSGAGNGSEYFRSLIMETPFKDYVQKSIVLPAAIFDVGSTLVMNQRTDIDYIKLTKMMRTTTAFTQFAYDVIDLPKEERIRIEELKRLKT
jgi:hypothetical protein